ncbi:MAG: hypothetical protein IKG27_05150 [Bacilli bacterium]|nr:hypothetical protein [Bacilli bacterium]
MIKINDLKSKKPIKRIEKNGKSIIIDNGEKTVYKEGYIDNEILDYLKSRNFEYMPNIKNNGLYYTMNYIKSLNIPNEQKIIDLIKITSLLHNKTTHYKEIDLDYYNKLYEDIYNNIEYLYSYYTDLITLIEAKVFPSPSEQLLERNISKIYEVLEYNEKKLRQWHTLVKNKTKERKVIIHGNLKIDNFIRNKNSYLISWDKTKIASPIFDLYKLYQNHALDFDFTHLLKIYENNYPLTKDEKELLFILINMPDKLKLNKNEYENCKKISKSLDRIYKTEKLILPETSK